MIQQIELQLPEFRRGYHLITNHLLSHLKQLPDKGLLNIFIQHTSAAITINENADPSVRSDFEVAFNHLVPENFKGFTHTLEGADDMPAHIKSSMLGQSLTIPITNGSLNMGIWQGVYLCEFRNFSGPRNLVLTIYS